MYGKDVWGGTPPLVLKRSFLKGFIRILPVHLLTCNDPATHLARTYSLGRRASAEMRTLVGRVRGSLNTSQVSNYLISISPMHFPPDSLWKSVNTGSGTMLIFDLETKEDTGWNCTMAASMLASKVPHTRIVQDAASFAGQAVAVCSLLTCNAACRNLFITTDKRKI